MSCVALSTGVRALDAAKFRSDLMIAASRLAALYEELSGLYRGWYGDSVLSGAQASEIGLFERRMAAHLELKRTTVRTLAVSAAQVAAASSYKLAGDVFRSNATQSASRDLESLTAQEIERCFMAQMQRDQAFLVILRRRERLRQLTAPGDINPLPTDIIELMYRPDSLGRRTKSIAYVQIETQQNLFSLTNALVYALLLARGDLVCALSNALEATRMMNLGDFETVQRDKMHPRSTLLIHGILDR